MLKGSRSGVKPFCCVRAVFSKQGSPDHGHLEAAGWSHPPDSGQSSRVLLPSCTPCSQVRKGKNFPGALGSWKVKFWLRRAGDKQFDKPN